MAVNDQVLYALPKCNMKQIHALYHYVTNSQDNNHIKTLEICKFDPLYTGFFYN